MDRVLFRVALRFHRRAQKRLTIRGFGPNINGTGNKMSIRKFDILDRIEVFDDSYEVAHAVRNCSEESFVYWRAEAEFHIIGLWEYAKDLRTENLWLRKLGGLKNG